MDAPRPCIVEVTQIVPPENVPVVAARVAERLAMPVERVQKLIDGRTGPITRPLRPDKAEAIAQTFEAAGVAVSIRLATDDDDPDVASAAAAAAAAAPGTTDEAPEPAAGDRPPAERPRADEAPRDEPPPDEPPPDAPPPDEPPPDAPPPDESPEPPRRDPPPWDDPVPAEAPGRERDPAPADLPRRDVADDARDTGPFGSPPGRSAARSSAGRAAAPARGGAPLRIEPEDDDDEDEPGETGHPARGEVPPRRRPLVVEYGSDDQGVEGGGAPRHEPSSGVIPVLGPGTHPTFTDEETWGGESDPEGAWILHPPAAREHVARRDDLADEPDADLDLDDPDERFDDLELPPLVAARDDDDDADVELDTDAAADRSDAWPSGGASVRAWDEERDDVDALRASSPERRWGSASTDPGDPGSNRRSAFEPEPSDALDDEVDRVPIAWRGLGGDESGPARPVDARIPRRVDAETLRAEEEAQRVVLRRTVMLWALVLAVVVFVLAQFWVAGRAAEGYMDGLHRFRDAQFASARSVWTRLAETGDPNAQFMLGYMSEAGLGQPWSARAAASWYRMAADVGHAEAQWRLGTLYDRGLGVPWSVADARRWWAAAADSGHAEAATALAQSLLLAGPEPQVDGALRAFTVAAALGRRDARIYLDLLSVVSEEANARAVP